jgi:predicted O-methyltransferase YrrM
MISGMLLRYNPNLKLYGIDLWESYPGYKDFEKNTIDESYAKALESVKGYDCTLIKGWSHEVVEQFEDESLDFVFIDGNHAFEFVVRDIAGWSKKVREGGIVCGHDYMDYSRTRKWRQMQVKYAVEAWMQANKIHPWFDFRKHHVWMYVK